MKSSKSGDEVKTSKSGDEGSAQPNKKLKTSKSGDEGSAQPNKAQSNTTNQGASEKTQTSTTNTGEEPALNEPASSNDNTKLVVMQKHFCCMLEVNVKQDRCLPV